ncbi:MAG: phosphoglycerate mutase (2,3-diphosphoglycerate-independent) [Clostridiaceae bacterium]
MKQQDGIGGEALAKAVERAYDLGQIDYSLEPLNFEDESGKPVGVVRAGDSVIFCCRRGEREIELTDAFADPAFTGFDRKKIDPLTFVILTMYNEKYTYLPVAFAPSRVSGTLAETLSAAGLRQLHCAESEKYAHVTFFLNGGNGGAFAGEEDVCIPSPKGVSFDTVPALSLPEVAVKVADGIQSGYDFIVTNFANGDVIGHTSNNAAKVETARVVDKYLGETIARAKAAGYTTLITADHGNLERMITPDGKPDVAHTENLVAFILVPPEGNAPAIGRNSFDPNRSDGALCDVAPTVLAALGVSQPADMLGKPQFQPEKPGKVLLIILDGWGMGAEDETNPIFLAETPVWDDLLKNYPVRYLRASGEAVGLESGKAGNSEAGHLNIGAGRVVPQDDVRLENAMQDGSFGENPVFVSAVEQAKQNGKAVHLFALLTKKSSHGSIDYPLELLGLCKRMEMDNVFVHIIFDGRSTPPGSAPELLRELEETMRQIGVGTIVSGVGRGIALDRDKNWAKVKKAYDSLTAGTGARYR